MQEVRKLKRELDMAEDKINTLTTQLSTNVSLPFLCMLVIIGTFVQYDAIKSNQIKCRFV